VDESSLDGPIVYEFKDRITIIVKATRLRS
jgi:hypothetical protein